MKFTSASTSYLQYVKATRSDGTYRFYQSKIDVLNKRFKYKNVEDIERNDIVDFINDAKEQNPYITANTLNKYIMTIKLVVKHSTEKDIEFSKLPMNNKVKEIIDTQVLKTIFDYYNYSKHKYREKLRNHTMFRLLYDTGLRISELLSLQVRDIDFDTSTIHVKITKTKNERYVFFTSKSKRLLKKLITMNKESKFLFINYKRNKRMSVNNVQKVCFRLEQTLNLPYRVRPHRWRHTFATTFLKNGGDLETLRLILGHSNLKTTQLYLHLDKDHLHSEYFKIFKR